MEKELKTLLRKLAAEYETKDFINDDPVRFVHAYADKQDMEIVGFIASWLAYGNRKVIVSTIQALINEMNYLSSGSPFVFIVERRWEQMEHLKDAVLYRFYKWGDFYDLCERLYDIYQNYTTMEQAVCKQYDEIKNPDWVQSVLNLFPGVKGVPKDTKSACKRVCMFMRWMVRWGSDVDLGIWSFIPTSKLIVPLDTDVARMARQLGLITVKGNNMRAAYQLTQQCRLAFPNDPAKADFALFGYGITHKNRKDEDIKEIIA